MQNNKKEPEKPQADWLGIVIHFPCGFIFGMMLYLGFWEGLHGGDRWHHVPFTERALVESLFFALIPASFIGYYQNDFWAHSYSGMIPPLEPQHSSLSRRILWSLASLGGLGLVLMLFPAFIAEIRLLVRFFCGRLI